jgi:hypothetical protein
VISFVFSIGFGALATYAPVTPQRPTIMTPTSEAGNMRVGQLQQAGAYVRILDFSPDRKATLLHPGDDVVVTVLFEYNLPGKTAQPTVQLKYLRSTDPMFSWNIIQQQVAQVGVHQLQLSGQFRVPELSALNGEPFQIAIEMVMLDEDLGRINSVAVEKIPMNLEATD